MDQGKKLNRLNKLYKDDKKQKLMGSKATIADSKSQANILDLKP